MTDDPRLERLERPAWVPEDLYPFASHHLDVAGARVHYLEEGGGPPLLLLHGNPTAFVIANTCAWPKSDPGTQAFSRFLGGPIGRRLILNRNLFVERILPSGVRRHTLSEAVMAAYRGPFPTPRSRRPTGEVVGAIRGWALRVP